MLRTGAVGTPFTLVGFNGANRTKLLFAATRNASTLDAPFFQNPVGCLHLSSEQTFVAAPNDTAPLPNATGADGDWLVRSVGTTQISTGSAPPSGSSIGATALDANRALLNVELTPTQTTTGLLYATQQFSLPALCDTFALDILAAGEAAVWIDNQLVFCVSATAGCATLSSTPQATLVRTTVPVSRFQLNQQSDTHVRRKKLRRVF